MLLTWKRLHQHGKLLPRHIQIRSPLHHRNDLRDDRVGEAGNAASKPDDRNHTGGIPLEMLDILLRRRQQVIRDDLALVVLEAAVAAHLLQADAHVRELAVQPPPLAVVHGHQVGLTRAQLAEDDHTGSRGVDARALVEQLVGAPGVADPDGGVAADPEGDQRRVVLLGQLLEVDPRLVVREEMGVADDGEGKGAGGLVAIQLSIKSANIIPRYACTDHFEMQIQHPRIVHRQHHQPSHHDRQDDIARPELGNCALQLHQREDVGESFDQHDEKRDAAGMEFW